MIPPLPNLEDYQISPRNGFLPAETPLARMPDSYYDPWEFVVANLHDLLHKKKIRRVIDSLPLLSTTRLRTEPEWRRAYLLLGFMSNSYIWGMEEAKDVCYPHDFDLELRDTNVHSRKYPKTSPSHSWRFPSTLRSPPSSPTPPAPSGISAQTTPQTPSMSARTCKPSPPSPAA